jgi:hypothetical protein
MVYALIAKTKKQKYPMGKEKSDMKRSIGFVIFVGLCAIATLFFIQFFGANQGNSGQAKNAASAAFRDGVYQARLAAETGEKPHLSTGRWSKHSDRRAYVAAYQQEYLEARGQDGITVPQGIEQAGYRDGLEDGAHDNRSGDAPRLGTHSGGNGNAAYREAYATGYQLAFYGDQQVQNALVIRPVISR